MLPAKHIKQMMLHKEDIIFGVVSRCNHEIQAAALKGEYGIVFEYPVEYDNYAEMHYFYQTLNEFDYTVVDTTERNDGIHRIEIYWAVD